MRSSPIAKLREKRSAFMSRSLQGRTDDLLFIVILKAILMPERPSPFLAALL
jgi:hypothetical protein